MSRAQITLCGRVDRDRAIKWIEQAAAGTRVTFKESKRSVEQNDKMWAMLTEVATQVKWHGEWLTPDSWKILFLDALNREMHPVPNIDGTGFVNLGRSSSNLTKQEFGDLIEVIHAFGAKHDVKFNDSLREEVVGIPETGNGQRDNLHHVAPVDSPPPEGRPEDNSEPAARAPQPERKEAAAVGGEGQEPVRSDDAKPATAAEYIARARAWIARQPVGQKGTFDVALTFFDSAEQVQLRTACRLSVGEGRMLRRELLEHFQGAKV